MSPARRRIAVELPPELKRPEADEVGFLLRAMYGTRDAATCWEAEIATTLVDILGFVQGRATPCNFYHEGRCLRVNVHGDDFETLGPMDELKWFSEQLKKRWLVVERGILGPRSIEGTTQQIRHLNRIITWTSEGITWEPDPRHADLVVTGLGVSQRVATPLVKEKLNEDDDGDDEPLPPEDVKMFQSLTMRLGYLSQDRPDLQRAVRELAKGMSAPLRRHFVILKRVG